MWLLVSVSSLLLEHSYLCILTFRRHSPLCSDDIWVASEGFQTSDGALAHHRLPAKWTMVNHLEDNGWCVHLILWKQLDGRCGGDKRSIYSGIVNSLFL